MTIEVRYYSRGGNTRKVAQAIAKAAGVKALDCSIPITKPVDLLFIGGSVYGFGLDDVTKSFISNLDPSLVKNAAVFGTSAIVKKGNSEITALLKDKNIPVLSESFYCRGEFTIMHKGHPNSKDLANAEKFALSAVKTVKL